MQLADYAYPTFYSCLSYRISSVFTLLARDRFSWLKGPCTRSALPVLSVFLIIRFVVPIHSHLTVLLTCIKRGIYNCVTGWHSTFSPFCALYLQASSFFTRHATLSIAERASSTR